MRILIAPTLALLLGFALVTIEGKCTGSAGCSACKNCSSCQHCAKDGGSCGVCANK